MRRGRPRPSAPWGRAPVCGRGEGAWPGAWPSGCPVPPRAGGAQSVLPLRQVREGGTGTGDGDGTGTGTGTRGHRDTGTGTGVGRDPGPGLGPGAGSRTGTGTGTGDRDAVRNRCRDPPSCSGAWRWGAICASARCPLLHPSELPLPGLPVSRAGPARYRAGREAAGPCCWGAARELLGQVPCTAATCKQPLWGLR